jgi:DNA replication initiation complex subunit (GINS family)
MTELTYEELRRIQSREREPGLSKIPEDFYERIPEVLAKYSRTMGASEQREYENVLKIIRYIYTRREEKILLAALNSLKGIEPPTVMLKEELESYKTFSELLKLNKEKLEKKICSFSPEPSIRPGAEVSRESAMSIKEETREIKKELKSSSLTCQDSKGC